MLADPKPVAAIVTAYRPNSSADAIVGRVLEGYNFDGKLRPELKLVSLFTDQVPTDDWSRALAKKHDVPIYDSIAGAVMRGTDKVAVAGVISIGENGDYPVNEKGQQLSPRRRFFEQTTATFEKCGQVVPVFNDRQLAADWKDARWMYDRSRELKMPFMAGSSLPVTWRVPALSIPRGATINEALAVGYGGIEASGFNALEMLQCMVERRGDGEAGVARVQCLEGQSVWRAKRRGDFSSRLLDAALAPCPGVKPGSPERNCGDAAVAFVIDYCDGLRATVLLLNGHAQSFGFAAHLRDVHRGEGIKNHVGACHFYVQSNRPYAHFTHLVRAIERLVVDQHAVYPVERTLLTTGVIEAALTSRHEGQRSIATSHLRIRYEPVDYAFAQDPIPG